ncbi:thioredoxin family protein [Prochlorococcus marinus]|uniref:thioredoxin family protein n=1 Tax=Prochlorococcus marinus TaxID=1219 RepID=UPI0022B5A529|nr:thioredoxin family protein [Prochlorococcus marinus]
MVLVSSTMLPLGTYLPSFDLPLLRGSGQSFHGFSSSLKRINNKMLSRKPILIMILCAHCPFVKHIESQISQLEIDFKDIVEFVGVASNCLLTHPEDGPDYLKKQILENNWRFPYLLDLSQSFVKSLKAACTPDFFLFSPSPEDGIQQLVYRGQLDESSPGNGIPVTGNDLREALDSVLNFKEVEKNQKPSIGCNIKWIPGSEPPWFG